MNKFWYRHYVHSVNMPLSALSEITGEEISPMPPIAIGGDGDRYREVSTFTELTIHKEF